MEHGSEGKHSGGVQLVFDSFEGGGPEYSVRIADPSVVSCRIGRRYRDDGHEETDGAGYQVVIELTGERPGRTEVTVRSRSPLEGNADLVYDVSVDESLAVAAVSKWEDDGMCEMAEAIMPTAVVVMRACGRTCYPDMGESPASEAFFERLKAGVLDIVLCDQGGEEKAGRLPWELPVPEGEVFAEPGDIVLHGHDMLGICCGEGVTASAVLARVSGPLGDELMRAIGEGDVAASFWLEWGERRLRSREAFAGTTDSDEARL